MMLRVTRRHTYYLVLALAVANISTASILVRLANNEGVHGFTVALWRLILSSTITWLLLVVTGFSLPKLLSNPRDLALMSISGLSLALHFMLWMHSLAHLNVAASVTIVDSYPALLAIMGRFLLREVYSIPQYLGSFIAFLGILGLSIESYEGELAPPGGNPLYGVILALGGMVTVSIYFVIGRLLRVKYSTLEYTAVVYTTGSLASLVLTAISGVEVVVLNPTAWVILVLVALIPMLGGHTLINFVLGKLTLLASTVPVLGEPVGATILAYIILGEPITGGTLAFMAITLSGIALVLLWERGEVKRYNRQAIGSRGGDDREGEADS